jgi:predicted RNA binding protein YcfA (HicA-like mRNA interferase family)
MPRPIKLAIVIRVLQKKGFFFVSQKGSHAKFRKEEKPPLIVIVKMGKKDIPHGTFQSILLHSKLKEEDFRNQKIN